MTEPEQLSLFQSGDYGRTAAPLPETLAIEATTLQEWKQRIADYQQPLRSTPVVEQVDLLGQPIRPSIVEQLDPFTLPQQNIQFWRQKTTDAGVAALYFVIDYAVPLLLYVGETVKSGQRWKGEHGCKDYLNQYCSAHYQCQQKTAIGIAFWLSAPAQTRSRQQLELEFILKWRSPFNKENWEVWGTPFVLPKL
jgi:hypothetical protein